MTALELAPGRFATFCPRCGRRQKVSRLWGGHRCENCGLEYVLLRPVKAKSG